MKHTTEQQDPDRVSDPNDDLEAALRGLQPCAVGESLARRIAHSLEDAPCLVVLEGGDPAPPPDSARATALVSSSRRLGWAVGAICAAALVVAMSGYALLRPRASDDGPRNGALPSAGVVVLPGSEPGSVPADAWSAAEAEAGEEAAGSGVIRPVHHSPQLSGVRDRGLVLGDDGQPFRLISFDFMDQYEIAAHPEDGTDRRVAGGTEGEPSVRVVIPRREEFLIPVSTF